MKEFYHFIKWIELLVLLAYFAVLASAETSLPVFSSPTRITLSDTPTVLTRNVRGSMMYDRQGVLRLVYTERVEGSSDIGESGNMYYGLLKNNTWSQPLPIRSGTSQTAPYNHGGNPALFVSEDGTVNFVWHDYRNSTSLSGLNNLDIYFRRLLPSGEFKETEYRITSHEANQYRPKIFGMPDGQLAIGWYDFLRAEGPDFLVTFSDSNGIFSTEESFETQLAEDANIDKEPLPGSHFFLGVVIPQFEIDSKGHLHAVWTTGFTETQGTLNYGLMSSPPDRSMNPAVRISKTGSSFFDPPKIRIDSNDTAWIIWRERVEEKFHNIQLAHKSLAEDSFSIPIKITNYNTPNMVEYPDFAVAPDGCIYMVWADRREGSPGLFAQVYNPAEKQLSQEIKLTNSPDFTETHPCIEISRNGDISIVYESDRDGNTELYLIQAKIETAVEEWRHFE